MIPVLANAGVPMVFWQVPAMAVALVPIIFLEAAVARLIVKMPLPKLAGGVALANVISTFVGIPVAWFGMLMLNLVTTGGGAHGFDTPFDAFRTVVLQASWLVPYEDQLYWMIPTAALVLLVPYFFISVVIERFALNVVWKLESKGTVWRIAWFASGASYAILALLVGYWLWDALTFGSRY